MIHFLTKKEENHSFSLLEGVDKSKIIEMRNKKDTTFFSVCRNPWDRVVSSYNKKVLNANNIKKIAIISQYSKLYPQMGFEEFLKWLVNADKSDSFLDPHWERQYEILTTEKGKLICSELLKLEEIDSQFSVFAQKADLYPTTLPSKAFSSEQMYGSLFNDYRKYYSGVNSGILRKLDNMYKKDNLFFGYPSLKEYISEDN
jgi:hypothetical protein